MTMFGRKTGLDCLKNDERILIERFLSDSQKEQASFYEEFFKGLRHHLLPQKLGMLASSSGVHLPSQSTPKGTQATCGLICSNGDEPYLLELVIGDGMPKWFSRTRCSVDRAIGDYRAYNLVMGTGSPIAGEQIEQLLGLACLPEGDLIAYPPASSAQISDLSWRAGASLPDDYIRLLQIHAIVETEQDTVWTVMPQPSGTPDRTFMVLSSTLNWRCLISIDHEFPRVGFRYDEGDECRDCGDTFLKAYEFLAKQSVL